MSPSQMFLESSGVFELANYHRSIKGLRSLTLALNTYVQTVDPQNTTQIYHLIMAASVVWKQFCFWIFDGQINFNTTSKLQQDSQMKTSLAELILRTLFIIKGEVIVAANLSSLALWLQTYTERRKARLILFFT